MRRSDGGPDGPWSRREGGAYTVVIGHAGYRFAGLVVDRPQAVVPLGHAGRGDHHLLPDRALQSAQGRHPTDIEFVGVVEDVAGLQSIAGVFDRRDLT